MSADTLLDRLEGVRETAPGRWRARCPAHDGKNRDVLSIGECGDGTVVIHCFAGCTALDVVHAVGLDLRDLFPSNDWQVSGVHAAVPRRPRTDWRAMILACERDLILVKIALEMVARAEPIGDIDAVAFQAAATRVYQLIQEQRELDAAYRRAANRARDREREAAHG